MADLRGRQSSGERLLERGTAVLSGREIEQLFIR